MKNARLCCFVSFAFGSALTLFLCTLGPSQPVQISAREHPEGLDQWSSAVSNGRHSGTIEAVEIPLANPDGTFADREDRLRKPEWLFENFCETGLVHFLE